MPPSDVFLIAAGHDLDRLTAALSAASADDPVPGCEGWTAGELGRHVAAVLGMIGATGAAGSVDTAVRADKLDADADVIAAITARGRKAIDILDVADPATPMWSWAEPSVGFWRRRVRHELLVHRIDAEATVGRPPSAEAADAADAIDEFFTTYVIARGLWTSLDGASVHVHCDDAEGEWTLRTTTGEPDLAREHSKGDVALRGPALDLLLVLYGRADVSDTAVELFGDAGVAERVAAWSV